MVEGGYVDELKTRNLMCSLYPNIHQSTIYILLRKSYHIYIYIFVACYVIFVNLYFGFNYYILKSIFYVLYFICNNVL